MNLETKITIYKFTPQLFTLTRNLFFFVENTVELLKKNYICTIHY